MMNTQHLTEEQLQYYADNPAIADKQVSAHAEQCLDCRVILENYRSISTALKEMPSPAFDFDFAEELAMKVSPARPPLPWAAIIAAIAGCLLIVVAVTMFGQRITSLFATFPAAYTYLLTIPLLVLLAAQSMALFIGHQRKMRELADKYNLIAT